MPLPSKPSWAAPGFENAAPQHSPILLPIKGTLPPWLSGSLYRTGPGTFHIHPHNDNNDNASEKPKISVSHWFDGLGMNHHFKITPTGKVYYSNRSSTDGRIEHIRQTGRAPSSTFGKQQDPCEQLFKKFFTTFVPHPNNNNPPRQDMENVSVTLTPNVPGLSSLNNNNTNSSGGGLRYIVAATDSSHLQILDPTTLQPLHTTTYAHISPLLSGHLSAAHSCTDPVTHEHFNYVQKFSTSSSSYKVFRLTPTGGDKPKVDILAEIRDAPMAYIHSFALTKRFVVLCVWQCDYGENGIAVFKNKDILSSIEPWNPNRQTLFYIISREHGGIIAKYKAPAFFSFHTINAYETPSPSPFSQDCIDITMDISTYSTNAILDMLYLDNMRTTTNPNKSIEIPQATRYILPSIPTSDLPNNKSIPIQDAQLSFTFSNIELPTIHPGYHTSKHRYVYGTHRSQTHAPGVFTDKLIKLDMDSQTETKWGPEESGYTTGEPIFVPRPRHEKGKQDEDDGAVLSIVLDGRTHKSMLVVLDAKDMKEVARAEMDRIVPLGFHGFFSAAPDGNTRDGSTSVSSKL